MAPAQASDRDSMQNENQIMLQPALHLPLPPLHLEENKNSFSVQPTSLTHPLSLSHTDLLTALQA